MRRAVTVLCVVALVACGCGDQSSAPLPTTSPPATTPGTSRTAPTATPSTTVPPAARLTTPPTDAGATTTEVPSAPTTGELPTVPAEELAILRAGGIATADVGTLADETLTTLTELLGPPSRDIAIDLAARECVEGSDWADCARAVAEGRILTWDDLGLDVLLTDYDITSPTTATALHFGGWRLRAGAADTSDATLATTDGLRIGSLLSEVRRVHPDVELYINEGVYDTFTVYPGGRLAGYLGLTWSEQVRMVQNALVASGADIAVDGELGPATLAAWDAFVATEGLTGETGFPSISVLAALGITFDDVPVTELWSA